MKSFKMVKSISIGVLFLILALGFTACSKNNTSTSQVPSDNNSADSQKSTQKSSSETKDKKEEVKQEEVNTKVKTSGGIEFTKKELDSNTKVEFNTPWESSEGGTYSATIEGKGEEAIEEGQGKIILKGNDKVYSFELINNSQKSPKSIEWADDENLLVVIGMSMGTVSKGGNLYMLNVNTGKVFLVLDTPSDKQQVMSAEKNGNKLNLKVNVYDDDVYNKSHIENWVIEPFDPSLNSDMKVRDSSGKLISEI
ncbi:MAG: DUF4652 domain-containing protein [Clostridium sp.]|jgi:hypothetical protein|uniref:DUF4652 domain-containing protein n=1 Tax=Clostridium sp. TaxID=1506 RepID=UPI0025BA93DB|nr:DUF4652 domain-containing protein [Clostridium sp.]MCH3965716.1 DUF4652 domain-containing protein [Clostridium sp.]MCI1717092.1 DUF4652 domain-containing protein [Clostridium sp.]MCI1801371.1 DUF4652 domain-containing protein [Clostridium sp.]MCI1815217.1 DUF4652 domain-containing protein [Clostridium sp.]MCI1872120.1 DUF4652 domain-containing protein [Clostridium sp.]